MRRVALLCVLALAAGACGGATPAPPARSSNSPSLSPSPGQTVMPGPSAASSAGTPSKTPVVSSDETAARYRLDDRYEIFFCDPDEYPVGVDDETRRQRARDWYAQNKNSAEARAMRTHHGYREPLTDEQIQVLYHDHKRLRVISMQRHGAGWDFELVDGDQSKADSVAGTIADAGTITERSRKPAQPSCPVCLEPSTLIDTPSGPVPVSQIRPGDRVWTTDASGRRVAAGVERLVRRTVPSPHPMVRVELRDGRTVIAAAAHPDASGRSLWSLRAGDALDGSSVRRIDLVASRATETIDLRPAGPTGTYWANGILLGSTLADPAGDQGIRPLAVRSAGHGSPSTGATTAE